MKWIVSTLLVLIATRPTNGQGENSGLGKAHRAKSQVRDILKGQAVQSNVPH